MFCAERLVGGVAVAMVRVPPVVVPPSASPLEVESGEELPPDHPARSAIAVAAAAAISVRFFENIVVPSM